MLHRLLLVLDIGIHCVHNLLRLALSRLDDGNAIALHHHGREGGGKIGVAALGQVQQGEQHVLDLIVQVLRRIAGAVAVLGGELAVLCRGEDHIIIIVLGFPGIVDDLGVVFGGGIFFAAAAGEHQQGTAKSQQSGKNAFFHGRSSFRLTKAG